jgi:membrane protein DedA with SNARE-associated domain
VDILTSLRADSPISYLIAFLVPGFDAIIPVLPAETLIIALGVATAAQTDPRVALLVGCAALGAFIGDNLAYLLGRKSGSFIERRFFSSDRGAKRRAWAEQSLERFGILIIVICRFIPAGRTAVTLSCGLLRYSRPRFVVATGIGAVIWALYAFFAGRLGGRAFQHKPWAGFLAGLAAAVVLSGLVEVIRLIAGWRAKRNRGSARL